MWSSAQLKSHAQGELRVSYWLSFAVCLVAGILTGGSSVSFRFTFDGPYSTSYWGEDFFRIFAGASLLLGILSILYLVFVGNPILVGQKDFFIRAPYGNRDFGLLFSAFKNGRYLPTVKTMFMVDLRVFLWSLLFIIPGIIKMYEYCMVPYIINESPNLTPEEAMEHSRRMTDGHKADIFVLHLSFIGWYLLGVLCCGVGVLFVTPYVEATMAQLYFVLRQNYMNAQQAPRD